MGLLRYFFFLGSQVREGGAVGACEHARITDREEVWASFDLAYKHSTYGRNSRLSRGKH